MGKQVAVTLDEDIKPNYVVSTVLAPAFAVAAGELVLWVGNSWTAGAQSTITGLRQCLEGLRENGTTTPATDKNSYAKVASPGLKKDVSTGFNVTDLTLLTGTVTVGAGTKAVVGVATTFTEDL